MSEVLRSPGRPLDQGVREFMEPRFGHDFAGVRLHDDTQAKQSAVAMNALAYTVGQHIVFGIDQNMGFNAFAKRVLAHELTHTLQQPDVGMNTHEIKNGSADDVFEQEADRTSKKILSNNLLPSTYNPSKTFTPLLSRWKIAGNIATSDDPSDTLGRLAQKTGAHFNDWKCIKPVNVRTSTLPNSSRPSDFNDRYELYVQIVTNSIFQILLLRLDRL